MSRSFLTTSLSALGLALGLGMVTAPLTGLVDAAGPAATKIATVDLERTLYDTPAGKRASEAFEKARKGKQGELDKKQKDLQKTAAELDKQAAVLKPEVLAQRKSELEKRFVEVQQIYLKLERDLAEERTKLIQDLLKKAGPIITELAKADGVHLVIDQSAVLWATPDIDLTPKLNARMK